MMSVHGGGGPVPKLRTMLRRRDLRLLAACLVAVVVLIIIREWSAVYRQNNVDMAKLIRNTELLLKPPATAAKHDVLLSSYMNSGSRFTGRLLGFRADSFYFYEPLWKFMLWEYYRPPATLCSSTVGGCRKVTLEEINQFKLDEITKQTENIMPNISSSTNLAELFLHVISSAYTCNLVPLKHVVQDRVQDHPSYAGPSWASYGSCIMDFKPKSFCLRQLEAVCRNITHRVIKVLRATLSTFRPLLDTKNSPSWASYRSCIMDFKPKSFCLRQLETVCRNTTHRVIKVLRATLSTFRPLLETNPRLKIVHLVRDPRAIINSRAFSRGYPIYGYRKNNSLESNLCDKMSADYYEAVKLMKLFPNRVKIIYYEDLMSNLHARLKRLFSFLNMKYNETEIDSLAKVQTNLAPPEKGIDFAAARQDNNANWWRTYMTKSDLDRVDSECYYVYRLYGYRPLTERQLRDLSIPNLKIPEEFDTV